MAGLVCREFDEFADALRGVDGRYLLTARATHAWKLQVVDLGDTSLMWGQDGAANVFHAACLPNVYSLFLPLVPGDGVMVNGSLINEQCAAWLAPGAEFHMRARSAQQWLAVTTEAGDVLALAEGQGSALPTHTHVGRASPYAIARLIGLSFRILAADRDAGGIVETDKEALRARLVAASVEVARSLDDGSHGPRGRPALPRGAIIGRALRVIDAQLDQIIRLSDLCEATGVSVRTLNSVFHDHLEVSPHQYIMMRRLHCVHAAIRSASPDDTVSDICSRFGIWDFGRFARTYRSRFGVAPSRMLARIQRGGDVTRRVRHGAG
ncbi:helix-turn-helix transcriptional regulator [Lysobacter auxotrophicus]|uniref:Helix-turn-helix domain-containing protein n=1 Tax=Lysobacter auxotrophicus TaxID=2992573 RepID=A0ABN6UK35_9GAMM|nr:helix-turn-helix transcriptional regulator [Lysobacter auxotrophicus]BDU16691.1 helix-turn-helix domain-containing protein [Lysobacter auxotrophicus]